MDLVIIVDEQVRLRVATPLAVHYCCSGVRQCGS